MKTRDAALILTVIGVAGALSFVALQSSDETASVADGDLVVDVAGASGIMGDDDDAALSDKDADADKPPTLSTNDDQPPTASAAIEEAPDVPDRSLDRDASAINPSAIEAGAVEEVAELDAEPASPEPVVPETAFEGGVPELPDTGLDLRAPELNEDLETVAAPELDEFSSPPLGADAAMSLAEDEFTSPEIGALAETAPEQGLTVPSDTPFDTLTAPIIAEDSEFSTPRQPESGPRLALDAAPTADGLGAPIALEPEVDAPPPAELSTPDIVRDGNEADTGAVLAAVDAIDVDDVNDPASFPEEPGRGFVTLETERPEDVAAQDVQRPALGAPLVDGEEDPEAGSRDLDVNVEPDVDDPVVAALREGADFVETPISPVPPDPAESAEDDVRPTFDVVRVESDGSGVLAGRAEPGALVTVLVDGNPSEIVRADPRGEFVVLLFAPEQAPLSMRFDLEAQSPDGTVVTSLEPVIVTMSTDPARPPIVVQPQEEGVQVLGPVGGSVEAEGEGRVVIESVSYGEEGEVTIAGSGSPGEVARVYLDNGLEAESRVSPDGDWRVELAREVPPAIYTLRVDQLTTEGIITSRAETPFERAATDLVLERGTVVVQPGNNLWMIADFVYGDGERYTVIYDSNRDQIRDPDLIYPGQVLSLPGADPEILSNPG